MKVLILGAGYGTRLQNEFLQDKEKYKDFLGVPEPLLPVGGKTLASHWVDALNENQHGSEDIYFITNDYNHQHFVDWAKESKFPVENIINDGSKNNENRLGAMGDIELFIRLKKIDESLLIVGGDLLCGDDLDLRNLFKQSRKRRDNSSLVLWYYDDQTEKTGILETERLNYDGRVVDFLEKPKKTDTKSRMACPCLYLYDKSVLPLLKEYCDNSKSLDERDAPGRFLAHLIDNPELRDTYPVQAYGIQPPFDIGYLEGYLEANNFFLKPREDRRRPRKLRPAVFVNIKDIEPGTKGHNVYIRVGEPGPVEDKTRAGSAESLFCQMVVGDATGCINFTAKNEQIDMFKKGAKLIIRNAEVKMYQSKRMQLTVPIPWGLVEPNTDASWNEEINTQNDLSATVYKLVDE